MPVTATRVNCPANSWTMVATGAASTVLIKAETSARLMLVPTNSNGAPADANNALPLESFSENNLATDSGTYWWVLNHTGEDVSVKVWAL